ncbi:MAG: YbbR-like domain-containing protein [Kiritimatiellae bacterium]|nr:YbbR-like domain-containing protein [Kiritimatiellia bacterium]
MQIKWKTIWSKICLNWGLKVLALVLGTLTFYGIRWATGNEKEFTIPVAVDAGEGIAVLAQNVEFVTVTARGTLDDMLKLDSSQMRALIQPREGDPDGLPRKVVIGPRDIEGAPNVSIVKIEPNDVILTFDREIETTFLVATPTTKGRPLIGRIELEYSPSSVKVAGPKRRLEELKRSGLDSLQTEAVNVDGRVESFSRRVAILPPEGTLVSKIEPSEITVKIKIVRDIATSRFEDLPIMVIADKQVQEQLVVEPAAATVTLEGQPALVASAVSNQQVRVFVDCAGLDFSEARDLDLRVYIPVQEGVTYRVEPERVTVRVITSPNLEDSP